MKLHTCESFLCTARLNAGVFKLMEADRYGEVSVFTLF
jgi:hypothetical protein